MTNKELKKKANEYAIKNSNKSCTRSCNNCWLRKTPFGFEQYNIQQAFEDGAKFYLENYKIKLSK